ncbi:MAG: hypothetical protein H0W02_18570 [Ktedonobacteraceae bacterium]|nr:hypothetical protein [Ktedonobacteraceae bacterium]
MKLAFKMTPQRNTQYTNMVETLAAPELLASPLGSAIVEIAPLMLGGQGYLLATLKPDALPEQADLLEVCTRLGATSEVYEYYERIGEVPGPLLRPLEPTWGPFVPLAMAETRRYKGKTNEIFTQVLLNMAIFAGAYREQFCGQLRVLDPLAGGGTTLFVALAAGYNAFGIEQVRQDVETTAVFSKQYFNSEHIPYKEVDERRRRAGHRYQFEVGRKGDTRLLVLAHGDTCQADLHMRELQGGSHMHAIIADLPYGIQHFGELAPLLRRALPIWSDLLLPGGTLALAWNATHIDRQPLVELIEQATPLHVRNEPPYTTLAHTVDRVIKRRDVLVASR